MKLYDSEGNLTNVFDSNDYKDLKEPLVYKKTNSMNTNLNDALVNLNLTRAVFMVTAKPSTKGNVLVVIAYFDTYYSGNTDPNIIYKYAQGIDISGINNFGTIAFNVKADIVTTVPLSIL